jgi:hypothetical protein
MGKNMIGYYEDWKSKAENPKVKKYCQDRINEMLGVVIVKKEKSNYNQNRVFVKSLNKTFINKKEASFALGKCENYVGKVLKGKFKDKFGIVELID